MEDGRRHKKGRGGRKPGGFGIPLLFRVEPRRHRAHKPRTCKHTCVNVEGPRRACDSDCWLGTNVNMVGAPPMYWHRRGRLLLPATFLPQRENYARLESLSNTSLFSSSVVWELMWRRRGPLT